MSWKTYLDDTVGSDLKKDIAAKAGVDASTVSRWFSSGEPGKAENVIGLARGYGKEPLGALVAAGFLTGDEANMRPSAEPDFSRLSNDELLKLVRARMREEVTGNAEHPAAKNEPAPSPGEQLGKVHELPTAANRIEGQSSVNKRRSRQDKASEAVPEDPTGMEPL